MALSNPPAIVQDSPIARLDDAVIRLRIGDVTYGIPLRDIGVLLDAKLPDFVKGQGPLNTKEQALRSGVKALVPMLLRMIGGEAEKASRQLVEQGAPPLPLPDLKARHADLLDYATRYLAALILSLLAANPWEAQLGESVEGSDGYIRLSGLSGGVAFGADRAPTPDASGRPADTAGE